MAKQLQRLFLLPRLILTCMDLLRVGCVQTHSCIVDQSTLLGKPEFLLRYKICRLGLLQRFGPSKSCLICLLQFLYSLLCSSSRKANKALSSDRSTESTAQENNSQNWVFYSKLTHIKLLFFLGPQLHGEGFQHITKDQAQIQQTLISVSASLVA